MTIGMTPLLRGAGTTGQEPTAAAGATAGSPHFAELLSRQAGSDAAGRGQPVAATRPGEPAAAVPAELGGDMPSASGEGGGPALSSEPADKAASSHDDNPYADTELEPAEAAGSPVVADVAAEPGKSLPAAAERNESVARPDAAGQAFGKEAPDTAPATSPQARPGLRDGEKTASSPPVSGADAGSPPGEPEMTEADDEGWTEKTEIRGNSAGIRTSESDLPAVEADAEGRKENTGTRANGADIRIDAPGFRPAGERASTPEEQGAGDEPKVKETEPRATGAEITPKVPGGEAGFQFKAASDGPVSAVPPSVSVIPADDPAAGTKATEAVVSRIQSGGAKTPPDGLSGAREPGTELPAEPKPLSAPPAGEGDGRGAAPALPVEETPVDVPVRWFREGRAQGLERNAPPATAAGAVTPEWLAQIEHGLRWQQGTEGAGGKPLPPAVEPEAASGEMAAEPDVTAGKPAAEALLSGHNPASGRGEGAGPLVPEPAASAAVAPNRDGVQGTAPQPERPVTPERALTLQGSPEHGARQLAQQVQVMVSQNLQEADIRLSPSELGGVRIQLKMEQGEVNIQFLASQPQARELLDQALPRLRDMLVQQGITLGQGQVGGFTGQQGAPQQGAAQQQGSPGHGQHARQGGEVNNPEWTEGEPAGARRPTTGTIDFFA